MLRTYLRIEDLDSTTLQTSPEYNLLAKKGILHQLANDRKLGWVSNYIEKLSEYVGNKMNEIVDGVTYREYLLTLIRIITFLNFFRAES